MEVIKGKGLSIANGRSLEADGKLPEAADIYQQMVDRDPTNQEVVARLLLVYRKLKEYRKELKVIDAVLAAYQQKDSTKQAAWLKAHPKAAGAGKAMLRTLGGTSATSFGVNPAVTRLLKRKELVQRKISGTKAPKAVKKKAAPKKKTPHPLKAIVNKGKTKDQKRAEAAEQRRIAAKERKEKAEQQRRDRQQRKEEAAAARKEAAEKRRMERAEEKERIRQEKQAAKEAAAAKQRAAEKPARSLFVISLRYLVSLDKIDAAMDQHIAFLNRHYKANTFLVSGRQVPRTGGIIIARGKNRDAVEKLIKQDPFIKKKMASFDIVEFSASQSADTLKRWLK